jgi:cyclase
MARTARVIARLDIKGPDLVKGIHLEGLRVLGRPELFARHYYEQGADEILYMDVVASLYNRNSLHDIISRTAREIFIPLTIGGGLRTIEDIRAVLRAGADKVALNTAAINNPEFVREAARTFGSSTIVVSIEAARQPDGRALCCTDSGREQTGVPALDWARRAAALGAGEIMLTSIDREGTGRGFDIELTRMIAEAVEVPVIACGGAGAAEHVCQVFADGKADAVAVASLLHYDFIATGAGRVAAGSEGNTEFLRSGRGRATIAPAGLVAIKDALLRRGIPCRSRAPAPAAAAVPGPRPPRVAIVDYRLGNLFSVQRACEQAGLQAEITADKATILASDALILPGVGTFGDAMQNLRRLDLVEVLRDYSQGPRPFLGVCLGLQLLFTESEEFGTHAGLNILEGKVVKFPGSDSGGSPIKVPHVGWDRIVRTAPGAEPAVLRGVEDGSFMYFVHSFYAVPADARAVLTTSAYAGVEYCSAVARGALCAFQFHPEKSAGAGLKIYRNWAGVIRDSNARQP